MFDFAKAAPTFNEHIKGQLFWHEHFLRHFLPEIASVYMEPDSVVYDFGASTGNVGLALRDKIKERNKYMDRIDEEVIILKTNPAKGSFSVAKQATSSPVEDNKPFAAGISIGDGK